MEGLASLYRNNPYEKKAKMAGEMMPHSGLAKPLVAMVMGQEMAKSGEWEDERYQFIDKYLQKKLEAEGAEDKRKKLKADQETLTWAYEAGQKIWNATAGDAKSKSEAVTTAINPILTEAGIVPLAGIHFDEKGQVSYSAMVGRDEKGNIQIRHGRILANGTHEVQTGVDEKGQPVFEAAPKGTMNVKDFVDLSKPKTVQKGNQEVTTQLDVFSGQETEMGRGPKWKPEGAGGGARKTDDIVRDIRTTASQIASRLGDASLTEVLIQSTIKDPKIRAAMQSKKDPYIEELKGTLDYYKGEYQKATGKPFGGAEGVKQPTPAAAQGGAQAQTQARSLNPAVGYLRRNAPKMSQAAMLDALLKKGWSKSEIATAWKQMKGQ